MGLCVGIFVSIAVLLQELSELRTSVMVPVASANGRFLVRSQSVDPSVLAAGDCEYVKVMRLTASLFFANQVRPSVRPSLLFSSCVRGGMRACLCPCVPIAQPP